MYLIKHYKQTGQKYKIKKKISKTCNQSRRWVTEPAKIKIKKINK